jgi:hypothetical protein
MASATPATLRTRCGHGVRFECQLKKGEKNFRITDLRRARQHTLTRVESRTGGILDFFDLRALFPDDGTHARVGDHKLDGDGAAAWNRGDVKRFVIDTSDYESKSLSSRAGG